MARHAWAADNARFTPLTPLPAPKIVAAAEAFSEAFVAQNVLKPALASGGHMEYASRGLGAKTFIDFDFGKPMRLAAFRHVQRSTIDTVAAANLVFSNAADFKNPVTTVKVKHVDQPGGKTFAAFAPVTARYVRWQVTEVMPGRSLNLGGQSIEFFAPGEPDISPRGIGIEARIPSIVERQNGGLVQPLHLRLDYPYAKPLRAVVGVQGQQPRPVEFQYGHQTLDYTIAAPSAEQTLHVDIRAGAQTVAARDLALKPAKHLTVYILPHSHTDIGYTAIQTDIEEKQVNNLLRDWPTLAAPRTIRRGRASCGTSRCSGPPIFSCTGSRRSRRAEFFEAVKTRPGALNGMYLNELTGLCRPEELMRLFRLRDPAWRADGRCRWMRR